MLRLRSTEQETKFRFENNSAFRNWKVNLGVNLDYSQAVSYTHLDVYKRQVLQERFKEADWILFSDELSPVSYTHLSPCRSM